MSNTGIESHPRQVSRRLIAVIIVVTAAVSVAGVMALKSRAAPVMQSAPGGLSIALVVEPFEVGDSVPATWDAAGFADSLVAQLSRVRGIHASSAGSGASYVLRGHVAMKEGRLVLATRLGRDKDRDTVWTATFWRSATTGSTVIADLASAVAEAVFTESARESLAPKRVKP